MIEENTLHINGGIMKNVNVSVENVIYVKKIIFGILVHENCCENGKYLESIMDDSVITCDEIIDAEAKSFVKETKKFQKI